MSINRAPGQPGAGRRGQGWGWGTLGLCLCLLLACVGCQSRSQAQNLADAQAGADTIGAGLGQPDAGVVARGVSSYVQAVTIEDGTALPPFGMTVAEISANPTEYARRAKV